MLCGLSPPSHKHLGSMYDRPGILVFHHSANISWQGETLPNNSVHAQGLDAGWNLWTIIVSECEFWQRTFESWWFVFRVTSSQRVQMLWFWEHNQLPLGIHKFKCSILEDESLKMCLCCESEEEGDPHFLQCFKNPARAVAEKTIMKQITTYRLTCEYSDQSPTCLNFITW